MGRPGEKSPQNQPLPQPPTGWQIFKRGAKYAIASLGVTGTIAAILILAGVITNPIGWIALASGSLLFAGIAFLYAWNKTWDEYAAARGQHPKPLPRTNDSFCPLDVFSCFGWDFCKEQTLTFKEETDEPNEHFIPPTTSPDGALAAAEETAAPKNLAAKPSTSAPPADEATTFII